MDESRPRYLLIVKVPKGVVIRDTPRPESLGGRAIRTVSVGAPLYAHQIHVIEGVQYARLATKNQFPEWVRVAEANGGMEYVDVIDLGEDEQLSLASSMKMLADSIILLTAAVREWARK
jgi:hypothetical protein